ncbi:MAG: DUF4093 domain-containing protein [Clostridia bacterium]|nr:DUF4093 domain-containing protein [Clostridia bacterium]
MDKLKIDRPIIVEGKYDKITLSSVLDANIIPTGGFSIFKTKEKLALIRRLGEEKGVIVLTDSDGAGQLIRAHLSSALPKDKIIHLYTPRIEGKERRKKTPSKEGVLGVEGMEAARLRDLFAPFAVDAAAKPRGHAVEKRDFYADGLSGGEGAAARREALAASLALPRGMSANALLDAINLLYTYDEYKNAIKNL